MGMYPPSWGAEMPQANTRVQNPFGPFILTSLFTHVKARSTHKNVLILVKKKKNPATKITLPCSYSQGFPLKSQAEFMPISQTLIPIVTRAGSPGLVASMLLNGCIMSSKLDSWYLNSGRSWMRSPMSLSVFPSVTMCFFEPRNVSVL